VHTPTLDRLANDGARLTRHYSQAAPCSPGRAALYTGTYQMNNRVVANGTPHRASLDNVALVARRGGYDPTLFGYTDQGLDPSLAVGDDDPRLTAYDGVLRGFSIGCYLPENQAPWIQWLRGLGYDVPSDWQAAVRDEPNRPAEHSLSAFLADRFISWVGHQEPGWFAHLSFLRPHPPYAAAGAFASQYSPDDMPMPIAPITDGRHPLHDITLTIEASAAPTEPDAMRQLMSQYYGTVSEVDFQLGRCVAAIEDRGEMGDTIIVITSDHGEQLGDHGLKEKLGFFPQSYHILGIWRDPGAVTAGTVVTRPTENVDVLPTLCARLGLPIPIQCDGRALQPLLQGDDSSWRRTAHYEWDWRSFLIESARGAWPTDRHLSRANLAVGVGEDVAYVQFGDGTFRCYDIKADPTWRTECTDDARILAAAQELLQWRGEHLNRDLTDCLLAPGRPGRWPVAVG
jgi:arylsulfatase A-like enzyme